MIPLIWEDIGNGYHFRARVFGGWLVQSFNDQGHASGAYVEKKLVTTVFVPDAGGHWGQAITESPYTLVHHEL